MNVYPSMNNVPRWARLIVLALTTLAPTVALQAVELRFLNVEGEEHSLKFTNKGKIVAVTADENTLSPPYQFDDAGPLVLFKEVVTEGKPVRVTVATLTGPSGLTHALVVLNPTDKTRATFAGTWIDDSPVTRPAGTILLLNRSRHSLSFTLDAEEFNLEPGGVHQMPFAQDINRIVVQADANVADKRERIFGNPLPVRAGVRVLLLLRDGRPQIGSKTNLVDMLSFYDRPPVRPEAPKSPEQ